MLKAFVYKLYPDREQAQSMEQMLETHRCLYNNALEERKNAYEQDGRPVKYADQSALLKAERKTNPFLACTNFSSCQATLRRLDKAFAAFFRRLKSGDKPGFPRFRGYGRFDSVEYPAYGDGCKLNVDASRVYFQHIGLIKVKLHQIVEGVIKTMRFKRQADGWFVILSCEVPDRAQEPHENPAVGIDLGLKAFLVTSDGEEVSAPKFYRKAQAKLRKAQRALSRCKRGSNRRKKAVQRVAKAHLHIANQRKDFHHKTALNLIRRCGRIAHEKLNILGIARTRLAKSTLDAGWAQFLSILHSKAAWAGVEVKAGMPATPHSNAVVVAACLM